MYKYLQTMFQWKKPYFVTLTVKYLQSLTSTKKAVAKITERDAAALDNIFNALKGKRIFDRFDLQKKVTARGMFISNDAQEWKFDLK